MKTLAVAAFVVLLCACSSAKNSSSVENSTAPGETQVSINQSSVGFAQAEAACAGALGSITFVLGHARGHGVTGVTVHEAATADPAVTTITFSDKATGKNAIVETNGHHGSVSGKNLSAALHNRVVCVRAD